MRQMARVGGARRVASDDGWVSPVTGRVVLVVEESPEALYRLSRAVPAPADAYSYSSLDELDPARLTPGGRVVVVLGPSQAAEDVLDRVGALTKSRPGIGAILVVGQPTPQLLRHALRAGIDDAIELAHAETQLAPAVVELLYRLENELSSAGARDASARQAEGSWVTSVFSPKGGVGKSVAAVNLAAALARRSATSVAILDLDLQFGDIGVMLRLQPVHTVSDAVSAGPLLDQALLRSFLACHERSGVHVLAAPTSPSEGDQVSADSMLHVLGLLREMFGHVVIDTPPHLSEVVLQALAVSDTVAFMVAMDVPSVKNARLGLQAFELLQLPDERLLLVLNRADSHVHLAVRDVERALERKVDLTLPSEALVPQSVNQGIPAVLEYPRSRFAGQVNQLADLVLARCRNGERIEGSIR
ncbi:MAG: AAA family ATPase [Acidimicrobiales bacterium]